MNVFSTTTTFMKTTCDQFLFQPALSKAYTKKLSEIVTLTLSRMKFLSLSIVATTVFSATATAGDREQAKRIHDRIAGVPPTASVLDSMAADIASGNPSQAAYTAMDNTAFYDVTLKNLAAPWTNEAMSSFVPFNDYTATVVGLVRDDADFRTLLYGDIVYIGDSSLGLASPECWQQ